MRLFSRRLLAAIWIASLFLTAAAQNRAPDAADNPAPLATMIADYQQPAAVNAIVLPGCVPGVHDCRTQISARIYRPQVLNGRYPLVLLLHGNHATCGRPYASPPYPAGWPGNPRVDDNVRFTLNGTCPPAPYVITPNNQGYAYIADRLAAFGYIVVSIDANRGITGINAPPGVAGDPFLIRARGRLVLSHLQLLSQCNRLGNSGLPACDALLGHIDFGNVGLMGHSRGGDGVRAAYNLYSADPANNWRALIGDAVTFKGIFEFAPTDFLGSDALGTAWNVLLPMCDGDVSNLQGVRPFDRMVLEFENPPRQKSTYTVWGANHNFYNTEWQLSDAPRLAGPLNPPAYVPGCLGPGNTALYPAAPGSLNQRLTGISSFLAFFRANVGAAANPTLNQNFNPLLDIPATVLGIQYPTLVFRGYVPSAGLTSSILFNDFDGPNGQSSYNIPDLNGAGVPVVNHGPVPNHDPVQRAGLLSWNGAGNNNLFYQMNWTAANAPGRNVTTYSTLDFRISRQDNAALNNGVATNFSIRLVGANGVMTRAVLLSRYTDFRDVGGVRGPGGPRGPVGGAGSLHPILQTVRIPLSHFGNFNLVGNQLRGVRFTFDQNLNAGMATGAVYVANVRFTNTLGSGVQAADVPPPSSGSPSSPPPSPSPSPSPVPPPTVYSGSIVSMTSGPVPELGGQQGVQVQLFSSVGFGAGNEVLVLNIGSQQSTISRPGDDGDLHTRVFVFTQAQFDASAEGDPVSVQYGFDTAPELWDFGQLHKSAVVIQAQ
ncbi:MAG TPA: hypothetical protein VHA33_01150 [Candidatus Angelobacter sp.]|jgi:hypothetical protein|nr:hypothetical protein [Candidatus Angelobacter sp.]